MKHGRAEVQFIIAKLGSSTLPFKMFGLDQKVICFYGKNEKKNSKKFKMADSKTMFFKIANSQYFFVKTSWIGPWVSRID